MTKLFGFVKKISKSLKKHSGFLSMIFITYGFGFMFICFSWVKENLKNIYLNIESHSFEQAIEALDSIRMAEIAFDSIVPTTIVYILSCLITNFEKIDKRTDSERSTSYNRLTLVALVFYTLIYALYMTQKISFFWIACIPITTLIILFLNVCSYRESNFTSGRSFSRSLVN